MCLLLVKCASVALAPKVAVVSPGRFIRLAHGVLDLACLTEGSPKSALRFGKTTGIKKDLKSVT